MTVRADYETLRIPAEFLLHRFNSYMILGGKALLGLRPPIARSHHKQNRNQCQYQGNRNEKPPKVLMPFAPGFLMSDTFCRRRVLQLLEVGLALRARIKLNRDNLSALRTDDGLCLSVIRVP